MAWNSYSKANFYLDKVGGKVSSGSASGNVVKLQLSSAGGTNSTLDYLEDEHWSYTETTSSLLYGTNGIPALTFSDVPVAVPVISVSSLTNRPATAITTNSAALNATLTCTGTNYAVYAHWNTVNGGTNPTLWTNSAYSGSWTNASGTNLSYTAAGLAPTRLLFYLPSHQRGRQRVGDQRAEFHDAGARATNAGAAGQCDHGQQRRAELHLRDDGGLQVSPRLQKPVDGHFLAAGHRAAAISRCRTAGAPPRPVPRCRSPIPTRRASPSVFTGSKPPTHRCYH